jgi:hypothetical protein
VPPGIADATTPNPVFMLTPAATVDEGNNWINVSWGPLALTNPSNLGPANPGAAGGDYGGGPLLANYSLSSAIDTIPSTVAHPAKDFFGNPRPETTGDGHFDPGAVEAQANVTTAGATLTSIAPNSGLRPTTGTTTVAVTITGTNLSGATGVTLTPAGGVTITITGISATQVTANFVISSTAPLGARPVTVTVAGIAVTNPAVTFTVASSAPTLTSVSPTSGERGRTVAVTLNGSNLTGATAVTVSGTGVTCTVPVVATGGASATSSCTIAATAALGARTISVRTPAGTSNTEAFRVTGATVALSAPAPSLVTGTTTAHSGTITVSNATGANAGPFTFTANPAVAKVGTAGGTFSITGGTCTSVTTLAPGATCTIVVTYTPSGTTTATAHVTVTGTGLATASVTGANFTAN